MDIKPFENKVWLSSPTMHGDELKYITEAYETNWMSTVGENINEVERQMAEKIGCGYAVALSCGTSALHLAMKLAGIKPGDEVLCSDMTFDATVNPVVYEGGVPFLLIPSVTLGIWIPSLLKRPLNCIRLQRSLWRRIFTERLAKSKSFVQFAMRTGLSLLRMLLSHLAPRIKVVKLVRLVTSAPLALTAIRSLPVPLVACF